MSYICCTCLFRSTFIYSDLRLPWPSYSHLLSHPSSSHTCERTLYLKLWTIPRVFYHNCTESSWEPSENFHYIFKVRITPYTTLFLSFLPLYRTILSVQKFRFFMWSTRQVVLPGFIWGKWLHYSLHDLSPCGHGNFSSHYRQETSVPTATFYNVSTKVTTVASIVLDLFLSPVNHLESIFRSTCVNFTHIIRRTRRFYLMVYPTQKTNLLYLHKKVSRPITL